MVQGISTLYFEAGSGPVILLVHGNATTARDWWQVMVSLASSHRTIALALPGYGDTSPLEDFTVDGLVTFLRAFADELGLRTFIAVGHSAGGLLVAKLALAHPERITRMVVADCPGFGRAVNPWAIVASLVPRAVAEPLIAAMVLPGAGPLRVLATGLQLRHPWRVTPRIYLQHSRITRSRVFLRTSLCANRLGVGPTGQRENLLGRLEEIAVPTLIIWGITDFLFPFWQAVAAARRLPQGKLAMVLGAGHVPYLDTYEEFMDALGPFVRDETSST
ncbi:alpha/beta fold hydrolase [Nocardia goodfellowii]